MTSEECSRRLQYCPDVIAMWTTATFGVHKKWNRFNEPIYSTPVGLLQLCRVLLEELSNEKLLRIWGSEVEDAIDFGRPNAIGQLNGRNTVVLSLAFNGILQNSRMAE